MGGSCHATLDAVNDEEMIKSCETLFTADPPTAPPPPHQEDEGEISFINVTKIKLVFLIIFYCVGIIIISVGLCLTTFHN